MNKLQINRTTTYRICCSVFFQNYNYSAFPSVASISYLILSKYFSFLTFFYKSCLVLYHVYNTVLSLLWHPSLSSYPLPICFLFFSMNFVQNVDDKEDLPAFYCSYLSKLQSCISWSSKCLCVYIDTYSVCITLLIKKGKYMYLYVHRYRI